jgi:hypothetical protein
MPSQQDFQVGGLSLVVLVLVFLCGAGAHRCPCAHDATAASA